MADRRCPRCSYVVEGRNETCPWCGHKFSDASASKADLPGHTSCSREKDIAQPISPHLSASVDPSSERMPLDSHPPRGEDTKPCPACGESVKAEALICRFCRASFKGTSLPGTQPPKRDEEFNRIGPKSAWLPGGALLVIGMGAATLVYDKDIDEGYTVLGVVASIIAVLALLGFLVLVWKGRQEEVKR